MGCSCVKGAALAEAPAELSAQGGPGPEAPIKSPAAPWPIGELGVGVGAAGGGGEDCPLDLAASGQWEQVSAWAWGRGAAFGNEGPTALPAELPVKGRSLRGFGTSWEQTLLVASSGALWAAGENSAHCLFQERSEGPQQTGKVDLLELDGQRVEAVAGGRSHIIAILEDGDRVLSWGGSNELGQLGHGGGVAAASVAPKAVALPAPRMLVRQVTCGEAHSLVLTVAGTVFAFGDNSSGALGLGTPSSAMASTAQPLLVDGGALQAAPVRAVAAGARHSLALTLDGDVAAWGCGEHGRLGLGEAAGEVVGSPSRVPALPMPARHIAAGGQHSAVILRSGACLLAGDNRHGQLAQDPQALAQSVLFVAVPGAWRAVALGSRHTLLLASDGLVHACGRSDQGQLGTGSLSEAPSRRLQPVALPPGLQVLGLAAGPDHGLALTLAPPSSSRPSSPAAAATAETAAAESDAPVQQEMSAAAPSEPSTRPWRACEEAAVGVEVPAPPIAGAPQPAALAAAASGSVAQPGVCAAAAFEGLTVSKLAGLLEEASGGKDAQKDQLVRALAGVFGQPWLLNASFCFPGLERQRLDCEGLSSVLGQVWTSKVLTEQHQVLLRNAAAQGLEKWGGDPRNWKESPPNLQRADQVRGLAVLLLSPMAAEPEASNETYLLVQRIVALMAHLPSDGRLALVHVIVEDLSSALRPVLVPRLRGFCNAAIRRGSKDRQLPPAVWEGLLVLDFLAHANSLIQKRLQVELEGATSEQQMLRSNSKVLGVLQRSNSKNLQQAQGSAAGATPPEMPTAAMVGKAPEAPVPAEDFELEALAEGAVPPDVELALFVQNARTSVPSREDLLRLRPHDDKVHCFTAHRHVLPASFLRRVLHAENHYRQALQQQQGFQDTLLAALQGQIQIGRDGGLINVDQSKFFFAINVRRDHLLEDTLQVLQDAAPADLQKQLKVTFRGEEGQDAGGVSREFFRLLGEQLFDLRSKFFDKAVAEEARVLWPDRASPREPVDFWMMGVVLGLAVYNSLPGVDAQFPVCIFRKLRGEPVGLDDLQEVQPTVAASMRRLLMWAPEEQLAPAAAEELFSSLFPLDFTISYEGEGGATRTEELKPGGKDVPVTLRNRGEFVSLYCTWVLTHSISAQFTPFKKGFSRVCESPMLQALTGDELARIVMGETDIELERLRPKAQYVNFSPTDQCIIWFWEVLQELSPMQRRLFLSFSTGSDRSPVGGLGELQLKIQRAGGDPDRLPSAHTCFNLVILPNYTSKDKLRAALLMAIENTEGFALE